MDTSPPHPRRKRSRTVVLTTLTAFGAAATLTACEGDIDESRLSEQQYGKAVTAFPYQSLDECKLDDKVPDSECETAQRTALEQNQTGAPRFESLDLCEEEFGAGNCNRGNGGGSFFTPLLTGFVIGQMLDGGSRYRYSPMYRSARQGVYYTGGGGGGGWLYRSGGGYRVGREALAPPVAAPRVQTRSSVVSRGGFGGRAATSSASSSSSRGGGWGGRGG
jgi:uncharacterized protein YgiB involved in biofilm formation